MFPISRGIDSAVVEQKAKIKGKMDRRDFLIKSVIGALGVPFMGACSSFGSVSARDFKLGVFDTTFGGKYAANPEVLEIAKSIGLDGVQVSSKEKDYSKPFASPETIGRFKAEMMKTGMEIASVAPVAFNEFPFISAENAVKFLNSSIDVAADLGSDALLLPFYGKARMNPKNGAPMYEDKFKALVEKLKEVVPAAEKKGVMICMENSISADDDKRIIDAVGSDFVKVYFDIMNFGHYGFKAVESIKALKGYIGQVHLKSDAHDLSLPAKNPEEGVRACIDSLIEGGYRGWFVFELHGFKKRDLESRMGIVRTNTKYVRSL